MCAMGLAAAGLSGCVTGGGGSVGAAPGMTTGRAEGGAIRNEPVPLDVSSALFPLTEYR